MRHARMNNSLVGMSSSVGQVQVVCLKEETDVGLDVV
jgi:hypothetical protein